jgi:hypothetical protein
MEKTSAELLAGISGSSLRRPREANLRREMRRCKLMRD